MNTAHDVGHNRTRRVIDAAPFALLLVVRVEEILVEVGDWVLFAIASAEVPEHRIHVGPS